MYVCGNAFYKSTESIEPQTPPYLCTAELLIPLTSFDIAPLIGYPPKIHVQKPFVVLCFYPAMRLLSGLTLLKLEVVK